MTADEIEAAFTRILDARLRLLNALIQGIATLQPRSKDQDVARAEALSFLDAATSLQMTAETETILRAGLRAQGQTLPKAPNLSTLAQRAAALARRRLGRTPAGREIGKRLNALIGYIEWRNRYAHGEEPRDAPDPFALKRDLARFLKSVL